MTERRRLTFCRHLESAAGRLVGTRRGRHLLLLRGEWTTQGARRTIVGWSSFSQGQQNGCKSIVLSSLDMSDVEGSWSRE